MASYLRVEKIQRSIFVQIEESGSAIGSMLKNAKNEKIKSIGTPDTVYEILSTSIEVLMCRNHCI